MKKLITIFISFFLLTQNSFAQSLSLIRDSETEDFLVKITTPLAKAAGLNMADITIYIVNDSDLNAFVMGGQNIFINTGLITKYDDPNILTGVIAHELGHIAGGHLARSHEEMQQLNSLTILSYLAGIAAAISGGGDAGYAILMGSNHVAQRLAVQHTRSQEESADKLALQYLKKTNDSPIGLMKLLGFLNQEIQGEENIVDEYALTHPISQKRINFIKANLIDFNRPKNDPRTRIELQFVIAKLSAFLATADSTLTYFTSENSPDHYARSIAYFKKGDLKNSLKELDFLIKEQPANGYFHELKGQILFENGHISESIKSYHQAVKFLSNNALAKISLGASIISLNNNDKDLINFAILNLNQARIVEKNNGQIFSELAKAYGKLGEMGKSYLALSDLNLLKQDNKKAKKYAKLALKSLDKNDKSNILKANDILATIDDKKDPKNLLDEEDENNSILLNRQINNSNVWQK